MPTAMSMSEAREAYRGGRLQRAANPVGSHAGQRVASGASFGIQIDLSDMRRLAASYGRAFETMNSGRTMISQAINFGLRKLNTKLKYKVKEWTGIRRVNDVTKGFKIAWSTPATLTGKFTVKDAHRRLTRANFGASWSRANPGATHSAWNRQQMAVGTFMAPGKAPIFKRVGGRRLPIKPLFGPNFAREIERHKGEVQADVTAIGLLAQREATRLLRVALTGTGRR